MSQVTDARRTSLSRSGFAGSRRSRRLLRAVGAATALVAVAAFTTACSGNDDGGNGSGSGAAGASDSSPGLTADTVKVGFVIVDLGELAQSLGFKQADYGGVEGQTKAINAIVNAVNANGGAGGRKIEAIIKPYAGSTDSVEQAEALCNAFTQDEQVFAVVLDGQFQNNARPCYAANKTIMIDETLIAQDQTEFQNFAPFLWSPTQPEYGSFLKTQLQAMQQQGFFNGNTGVAVVGIDNDVARRQIQQTVNPFLTSIGVTKTRDFFVDTSNTGTLGVGTSAALTGAQGDGLNKVIVVGGARILPVMLGSVEAAESTAQFGISSYDSPLFMQDNPGTIVTDRLVGSAGLGYLPAGDVRVDPAVPFPDPSNPTQVLCKQIIDAAGATPPEGTRPNYKAALQYCDASLFLKAVLDKAPKDLNGQRFQDAAWQVGTGYSSSVTFGGNFAQGRYASTTIGRDLGWDTTVCQNPVTNATGCFLYRGGNVAFASG